MASYSVACGARVRGSFLALICTWFLACRQGIRGDRGRTGRVGVHGRDGLPGPLGARGAPGSPGNRGAAGRAGSPGQQVRGDVPVSFVCVCCIQLLLALFWYFVL